jgi:uncharacterized protein (TIGR02594 family)
MNRPLQIAFTQYGITEIPGNLHNPEVVKYFTECKFNVHDDETSWCSAFMCWCFMKAGFPHKRTLRARDWLNIGEEVVVPQLGDIAIFWRTSEDSWQGHVGFYINRNGTHVWVLGGNQSNMVNITAYSGTQLLGYRRFAT